jgi:predicted DNA-binding transcriptional regulator YafY
LLKALQSHHYGLSVDELAERLECDKRTVQRDLKALDGLFPLQAETRDYGKKFWKLPDHMTTSGELQLTVTEMISLYLGEQLLTPLAGTPMGDGLSTALEKIRAVLPKAALLYFEELEETFLFKAVGREDYSGCDGHIESLNRAIIDEQVVRLTYASASKGREVTTAFRPYGMVLLGASLYCVGHVAAYDEVRTLRVSRVVDAKPTGETFERPRRFSLARHTAGAFGIFRGGDAQLIRVEFTGWAARNIREIEWHESQEIVADDGQTLTAEWRLGSTIEFKRWLLGYGRHAKVLQPKAFAQEVAEEFAAGTELYE